jgi:transposase
MTLEQFGAVIDVNLRGVFQARHPAEGHSRQRPLTFLSLNNILRSVPLFTRRSGECMTTRKRTDSWVLTDDFWARVEPLIPARARIKGRQYTRKPGAGRPPKAARQVFEAVVHVLRTGCHWKALPKERFGSASAVHKRFLEWERAGVFEAIWKAGLAGCEEMEGIAWRWDDNYGADFKAPLAQDLVGRNPADREKHAEPATPAGGRPWRPVVARRVRSPRP